MSSVRDLTMLLVCLTLFLGLAPTLRAASCPCGYRDPSTGALWTDAIITYFNETSAPDSIVLQPTTSPSITATETAGDTGSGEQAWAAVSSLNLYNNGFHNSWRTGQKYNNTWLNASLGAPSSLMLDVQPADRQQRITYGASIVSRRRDILYGSLRTSILPPAPYQGGTVVQIGIEHNYTDFIRSSIFSADDSPGNSSLQWTWSARDVISDPVSQNLTEAIGDDLWWKRHEHRIDWLNSTHLIFSNDGAASANFTNKQVTVKHNDETNLPIFGGPFVVQHYSSGDSDQFQSPPRINQPSAQIQYIRLFFNSTLDTRNSEFEEQCAAVPGTSVCDTEDPTLRGSTSFSPAALASPVVPSVLHPVPMYGLIAFSVAIALFIVLLIHALLHRKFSLGGSINGSSRNLEIPADVDDSTAGTSRDSDVELFWKDTHQDRADDSVDFITSFLVEDGKNMQSEDRNFLGDTRKGWEDSLADDADEEIEVDPFRVKAKYSSDMSLSGSDVGQYVPPLYQVSLGTDTLSTYLSQTASLRRRSAATHCDQADADTNIVTGTDSSDGATASNSGVNGKDTPASTQTTVKFADAIEAPSSSSPKRPPMPRSRSSIIITDNGRQLAVEWKTTIAEWGSVPTPNAKAPVQEPTQMAHRIDGVSTLAPTPEVIRTGVLAWLRRRVQSLFVSETAGRKTATGSARVEYLDGLRGFACFLVAFHHFMLIFYYGSTTLGGVQHYPRLENLLRAIFAPIFMNGGLNVGIFFCLAARVIANRFLVHGRLRDLAEAIHRRVPRLMFPISAAIVLNYFLMEADAFHWIQRLASRTWSQWSYYNDYNNLGVFINDYVALWFISPPGVPPQITTYATGILWTVPVIVQSSWTVFTCALVARQMPNASKRYTFYGLCWLCSWYANRFDYFFLAGLILADLDNRLHYREKARQGVPIFPSVLRSRLPQRLANAQLQGQLIGWLVFGVGAATSWLHFVPATGGTLARQEHAIHPNYGTAQPNAWDTNTATLTYTDPRFFDFCFVIGFFLLCDLCDSFRSFFQLKAWNHLGRNAFSLYLLHGVIFWSWGSWLCIKLLINGVPYWAAVLVVMVTSFLWLAALCEAFTRTFDAWGVSVSKSLWRHTSGGLGRRV